MPPRKTARRNNWTNRWTTRTYTHRRPTTSTTYPCNSPKFRTAREECQWRMGSYRNVYAQFTGAGTKTFFSPTNANKWMRYINSGAQVYKFNNKDFCRYFGRRWNNSSPRTAFRYLRQKYGTTIKDVTRGKGNCWLIATSRTPTARPFNNYPWK